MARFSAKVQGAAPLQIQVNAPSGVWLSVVELYAQGENTSGSASRPTFSRPDTPGSGSGTARSLDGRSTPRATVVTSFTSAPSIPIGVSSGSFRLPIRFRWAAPKEDGFLLEGGTSGLLYADASGGHLWSGSIIWEEV